MDKSLWMWLKFFEDIYFYCRKLYDVVKAFLSEKKQRDEYEENKKIADEGDVDKINDVFRG